MEQIDFWEHSTRQKKAGTKYGYSSIENNNPGMIRGPQSEGSSTPIIT
jgi:hypothetical protein